MGVIEITFSSKTTPSPRNWHQKNTKMPCYVSLIRQVHINISYCLMSNWLHVISYKLRLNCLLSITFYILQNKTQNASSSINAQCTSAPPFRCPWLHSWSHLAGGFCTTLLIFVSSSSRLFGYVEDTRQVLRLVMKKCTLIYKSLL